MDAEVKILRSLKPQIDVFFDQKVIVIAGVSRNKHKFGNLVYKELKAAGYRVLAINPNLNRIDGEHCFSSLLEIEGEVGSLLICTESAATVYQEALVKGVQNIWFQNGIDALGIIGSPKPDTNIILGECILMYACPRKLPHSIHRFVWRICGKLAN